VLVLVSNFCIVCVVIVTRSRKLINKYKWSTVVRRSDLKPCMRENFRIRNRIQRNDSFPNESKSGFATVLTSILFHLSSRTFVLAELTDLDRTNFIFLFKMPQICHLQLNSSVFYTKGTQYVQQTQGNHRKTGSFDVGHLVSLYSRKTVHGRDRHLTFTFLFLVILSSSAESILFHVSLFGTVLSTRVIRNHETAVWFVDFL
jgi:hypothetical protein